MTISHPSSRTCLLLIRHGQTEWNRVERFRGQADIPLNYVGQMQAQAVGQRIATEWQPTAIYASPLSRTMHTAAAIAQLCNLPVQAYPGLLDINYGDWQGLTPDEARAHWPEQVEAWYTTPHLARIPNGESLIDLQQRGLTAVSALLQHHAGETIVLVGHLVINRVLLLAMLGLGFEQFWRIAQDNCALNVIETDGPNFAVVTLNDSGHLPTTTA